jgi:hypothetical protein
VRRIVCIATRLWAGRPGFDFWEETGDFLFFTASRQVVEPPPPATCLTDIGVKRPRREVLRSYTFTPSYAFTAQGRLYVPEAQCSDSFLYIFTAVAGNNVVRIIKQKKEAPNNITLDISSINSINVNTVS